MHGHETTERQQANDKINEHGGTDKRASAFGDLP